MSEFCAKAVRLQGASVLVGVSMKWPGQARSVQGVLSLFVLMQLCLSAPGQPGSQR